MSQFINSCAESSASICDDGIIIIDGNIQGAEYGAMIDVMMLDDDDDANR